MTSFCSQISQGGGGHKVQDIAVILNVWPLIQMWHLVTYMSRGGWPITSFFELCWTPIFRQRPHITLASCFPAPGQKLSDDNPKKSHLVFLGQFLFLTALCRPQPTHIHLDWVPDGWQEEEIALWCLSSNLKTDYADLLFQVAICSTITLVHDFGS